MTVTNEDEAKNSPADWESAKKVYANEEPENIETKATYDKLVHCVDQVEQELLPKLSSTRVEAEAELFKEFEALSQEQIRLRQEIETTGDMIRTLFKEYNELKPGYIQFCKEELAKAPVPEYPSEQLTVAGTYQESYSRLHGGKESVNEPDGVNESGDEFQPAWASKSWKNSKQPTYSQGWKSQENSYTPQTRSWDSSRKEYYNSSNETSYSRKDDYNGPNETSYSGKDDYNTPNETSYSRKDDYNTPNEMSYSRKEDYNKSHESSYPRKETYNTSRESGYSKHESYISSKESSSYVSQDHYKQPATESSNWGRNTDSRNEGWERPEKHWTKATTESGNWTSSKRWEPRDDAWPQVTYEPDVRSPEKGAHGRIVEDAPYREYQKWQPTADFASSYHQPDTYVRRVAPPLPTNLYSSENRYSTYQESGSIPPPPRVMPVRTEYGMNNALGGSGSLA